MESFSFGFSYLKSVTFSVFLLVSHLCNGSYLPLSYMRTYSTGEEIFVKVNSLTSTLTKLPFSYYSLPYCRPQNGIKKSAENLGELLMGDPIYNSPYRFHMNSNESSFLCVMEPLNRDDVEVLKQRTRDRYRVNMVFDNLPVKKQSGFGFPEDGFYVGLTRRPYGYGDYINNHLKFTVYVHESDRAGASVPITGDEVMGVVNEFNEKKSSGIEILGFEVLPCSIKRNSDAMLKLQMYDKIEPIDTCPTDRDGFQVIRAQERVAFTYEVEFVKSDIRWPYRGYVYLDVGGDKAEWLSLFKNPLVVIFFLAGMVNLDVEGVSTAWFPVSNPLMVICLVCIVCIFLTTVRRDLARYKELDKGEQAQMNGKLSGWKLVVGDAFQEPEHSKLLCVMVAGGVQIGGMDMIYTVFDALGFMSPEYRAMILMGIMVLYLFLGTAAGYVAVRLWRTIRGDSLGWRSLSWSVACFFPAAAFIILTALNFLLWRSESTGVIPISFYFTLLFLFCVSVPLTLFGGFLGTRAEYIQLPVRTNQIPREIPARKYPTWLLVLGAGILPFGTLMMECFFTMCSIWFDRFYYAFGFRLIVPVLLVIACAQASVVLTYVHLCMEDWRWWWKAFFASGSAALYVFLDSLCCLVFKPGGLMGSVSAILCLGYHLVRASALMLSTGAIGFLISFYFVHYLYSSMKID